MEIIVPAGEAGRRDRSFQAADPNGMGANNGQY